MCPHSIENHREILYYTEKRLALVLSTLTTLILVTLPYFNI